MAKEEKDGNRQANFAIAEIFYEMANIFEIQNVKWKPQAYRIAAQTLESLGKNIEDIYISGGIKELEELPGIGEGLAKKIIQYIKTGKIEEHEKLKKSIPAGIYNMMRIPGVGGKKAILFYNKFGIKSIDELERAAREHKLLGMKGFKEKSEENIIEGIALMKQQIGRVPLKKAKAVAEKIIKELKKIKEVKEAIAAGSIRREKPTIRDIDIVVGTPVPEKVLRAFVKMPFVKKILGIGKEKAIIIHKSRMQVDIRVFTDEEFGAGLLYFTGDKQHNIWLRRIAIKNGWKLNEYGLFDNKTGKRIAGRSEEEIYKKLGVRMLEPEKRIGETK